jgi:hypothetical protein
VNILSEINSASPQTTPPLVATCDNPSEHATRGEAKPDFAQTLSGVVTEVFEAPDATTNTVPSTSKEGSSDDWVVAVEPKGIGKEHPRRVSRSGAPVTTSTSYTVLPERGHLKKRIENPAALNLAMISLGQIDTIPTAAPTDDTEAKAHLQQATLQVWGLHVQVDCKSSVDSPANNVRSIKNDSAEQLKESSKSSVAEKAISKGGIPISTSSMPVDIKNENRVGALSHQPGLGPLSSGVSDEMTLVAPVSPEKTLASYDRSIPAIRDVIEMHMPDHFDGLKKWVRKTKSSGEPRVVLQMPAIASDIGGAEIGSGSSKCASAPLFEEGHVRSANSNPFEVMDTPSAEPAPLLLNNSHHEVEIGVNDPIHGWVEIRTHKYAGEISASLSALSIEAQHNLRGQLTALTEYLATREIPINRIVMESGSTTNPGGQYSGESPSGGQGEGSRDESGSVFATAPKLSDEVHETLPSLYQRTSQIHVLV